LLLEQFDKPEFIKSSSALTLLRLSHIIILESENLRPPIDQKRKDINMNCFCELFQNEVVWLIIIALIILFAVCGNGFGCGC